MRTSIGRFSVKPCLRDSRSPTPVRVMKAGALRHVFVSERLDRRPGGRIGQPDRKPPEIRIVRRRRVPVREIVGVIGRIEGRVLPRRKFPGHPHDAVLFRAAGRRGVAPRQLPHFLARVGVDDPAVVELTVFACLADGVELHVRRTVEGESRLLERLLPRAAEADDGVGGRLLPQPVDVGRREPLARAENGQPVAIECVRAEPAGDPLAGPVTVG